jgi:flagellar basal-body rod modification protein FlgD
MMSTTIDTDVINKLGLSTPAPKKDQGELLQEDFLKLMTTQLKNQDPFKPMESGEFLGQIAQFGAVSGIEGLQKSFNALAASMGSNQALQATSLVGRSVTIETGFAKLGNEGELSGSIDLPYNSNNLKLDVMGPGGQLLRKIDLGANNAGSVPFNWDGLMEDGRKAPPGNYVIRASANIGGETVALSTYVDAKVESVSMGGLGQEPLLNLAGYGSLEFGQVKQVR